MLTGHQRSSTGPGTTRHPAGRFAPQSSRGLGLGLLPSIGMRAESGLLWLARWVMLAMLAVFFGLPVLWLFLGPSKTNVQFGTAAPISFGSFANYWTALRHLLDYDSGAYATWALNSLEYVAGAVAIALVLGLLGGYALAALRFPGRRVVLIMTLIAMVMPPAALILPLFLEMNLFHLLNTAFAVILPSGFFPFGVYLSYVYFSSSLPAGILEAARIDGANEFQIFRKVALPLAKPAVSLVAFFAFVTQWNNFFLVQVMIYSTNRMNLQTGLASIMSGAFYAGPDSIPGILRPELAMGGMLLALPIVILFLVIQRYLMSGLLAGYGVG
jgi:multiple sugar transport system permease protein